MINKYLDYLSLVQEVYKHSPIVDSTPKEFIRQVTFQVTNSCNLNCDYCYEHHKNKSVMTLDTAKKAIDCLIKMWLDDVPGAFITKKTRFFVIDFIGGEPLLELDLIDKTIEYFFFRCAETGCLLSNGCKFNICSNGLLVPTEKVVKFMNKYKPFLSLNVSIDGNKELHDMHRKTYDGKGSFDAAMQGFYTVSRILGTRASKMTFVPESFKYIYDSIKYMMSLNLDVLYCNYAYEPYYTEHDASVLFDQLVKVADYAISVKYDREISILDPTIGTSSAIDDNNNYCGGNGNTLCFGTDGKAYPCLRYAPVSLGEEKAEKMCVGDFYGIYNTKHSVEIKDYLDLITYKSQSPDKCLTCPVATGCGWCTANNYDMLGDTNKRVTNICWAHKARVLVCCYYYNKRFLKLKDVLPKQVNLPEEDALQIISKEEWDVLKKLEQEAIETFAKDCVEIFCKDKNRS